MSRTSLIRIHTASIAIAFFLALPSDSGAQMVKPLGRFEIGADFVNPSTFSHWAFAPLLAIDSFTVAPRVFIRDLRSLGITLANIHVQNVSATWPRDLIDLLRDSVRISIHDDSLMAASRWERRYFQVEDDWDFSTRTGGTFDRQDGYMTDSLRFDHHPRNYGEHGINNGILFQEGEPGSIVSGFLQKDSIFINGRYYLTIRMGIPDFPSAVPNDNEDPCLLLRMRTDSATIEWSVPGSAFYEGGTLRTGAIEYLPAAVPPDSGLATFVIRRYWRDTMHYNYRIEHEHILDWGRGFANSETDYPQESTRYLPPPGTMDAVHFDLELEYLGPGDIFVDAICFSNPQGYGFFVGDNNALPNFRGGALRDSIHILLENLGVSNDRNNNLAFLELQEAMPHLGCLTTMSLITRWIDEMTGLNDTIHTFNYGHPSGNMDRLAQENYNMVSSIYWYTNQQSLHRPEDPRFYSEAYDDSGSSFWYASRAVLRPFALSNQRASAESPFMWMPAVGIASHSFQDGHPWTEDRAHLNPLFDGEEVREPTAAELRAQVNLYLAYGAKSIMYYHYSSIMPNHVRLKFPPVFGQVG